MYCNRPCLFVCGSALPQPARSFCVASERFFIDNVTLACVCAFSRHCDCIQRVKFPTGRSNISATEGLLGLIFRWTAGKCAIFQLPVYSTNDLESSLCRRDEVDFLMIVRYRIYGAFAAETLRHR